MSSLMLGQVLREGVFMAICVDCGQEIGTFRTDDLLRTMSYNSNRGGTKCVSCRARSCYYCGLPETRNHETIEISITRPGREPIQSKRKCCTLCVFELEAALLVKLSERTISDYSLYDVV